MSSSSLQTYPSFARLSAVSADLQPMYPDRVALARKRLSAGYYDRDDVTDLTVERIADALSRDTRRKAG